MRGSAVEGSGLLSGPRARTRQSSPEPRFCGAFQDERCLLCSGEAAQGAGKREVVPGLIKAPLHPPPDFFPLQGAEGAPASNCRRGTVGEAAPERRSPEAALGRE